MFLRFILLFVSVLYFQQRQAAGETNSSPEKLARVVIVENKKATETFNPKPPILTEMIETGLTQWTGKKTTTEAWLSLLSIKDTIGIKVFSTPGRNSGTRPAVTAAVVESLLAAGFEPGKILIWDRRLVDLRLAGYFDLAEKYGVKVVSSQDDGYDESKFYETALIGRLVYGDVDFGKKGEGIGRKSYVSKLVTTKMTKIINLTPLLNHNLASISGSMYSLTLGSVDNILRFEMDPDRLANAIPELYALPQLGDRVVLNIVDALICQYQGEERTLLHYSTALDQLWFSNDPVAVDVLGIRELDRQRRAAKAPVVKTNTAIYENAALLDLGKADLNKIVIDRIEEK